MATHITVNHSIAHAHLCLVNLARLMIFLETFTKMKYLPQTVQYKMKVNLQQKERQKSRLTHDGLYNLHELAYDLKPFVSSIKTFPDLLVVCGHTSLAVELNTLLQTETDYTQLLSYDTTFKLGDFYLSAFLFRHTLFVSRPVIPAFFLIHERKFQSCHEELMLEIARLVPNLVSGKRIIPLVTDDEAGLYQVTTIIHEIQWVGCTSYMGSEVYIIVR